MPFFFDGDSELGAESFFLIFQFFWPPPGRLQRKI